MEPYLIGLIIVILILIYFMFFKSEGLLVSQQSLEYYDLYGLEPGPYVCLVAGSHGNEPAGTMALRSMIDAFVTPGNPIYLKKGHLRIIPAINAFGLKHGIRYQSFLPFPTADINRNYNENGGIDSISKEVIALTKGSDLVIDFHEGWGFHSCQKDSVGSSLSPSTTPLAQKIAKIAVDRINKLPQVPGLPMTPACRKFVSLENESCTIPTTLACHMEKNNRSYVLVETTGQEDIQPYKVRYSQVFEVVRTAIEYINS